MKKEKISFAINNIKPQYIQEAESYSSKAEIVSSKKVFAFRLSVAAAVILCLASGMVAFAGNHFNNWNSSISFHDGTTVDISDHIPFKKIPETAPVINHDKNDEKLTFTHAEIENILGFEILNYENAGTDELVYDTHLNNNGTIARIDLWWADFVRENESKCISVIISMLNENAEEGYILPFKEGLDATGEKEYSNTYELNSLNTSAVVYFSDFDNHLNATFIYDNVHYQFTAFGYTEEELVSLLQKLE